MLIRTASHRLATRVFSAALVAGALLSSASAHALSADENALIEGAKLCTRYLPRHERQYGIPEHLLAAIASTESGRFHRGLGLNLPWPWTINVNGRGYFFDTKEEAVAMVNKLRSEGYQSIDVGCMQVNLHHHPTAFASVEQAFDPAYNVGYAASFLKRNFEEEGSWRKATADYHSRTYSYGAPYADQVFGSWGRIVAKVADARAGRPVMNNYAKNTPATKGLKPAVVASSARVVRPSYRSLHMHRITVASKDRDAKREKGVLVIRPQKDDDDGSIIHVAQNTYSKTSTGNDLRFSKVNADPKSLDAAAGVTTVQKPSEKSSTANAAKAQPSLDKAAAAKNTAALDKDMANTAKGQFQPATHAAAVKAITDPGGKAAAANLFVFQN